MEGLSITLAVFIGILLRLGVPILVTVIIVYLLRRMDARWQEEARQEMMTVRANSSQTPCWEVKGCSPEKRLNCGGFTNVDIPCWQQFSSNGLMREDCLDCSVFRNSPVPVIARP